MFNSTVTIYLDRQLSLETKAVYKKNYLEFTHQNTKNIIQFSKDSVLIYRLSQDINSIIEYNIHKKTKADIFILSLNNHLNLDITTDLILLNDNLIQINYLQEQERHNLIIEYAFIDSKSN